MKNYFFYILIVCFFFASCGSENNSNNKPNDFVNNNQQTNQFQIQVNTNLQKYYKTLDTLQLSVAKTDSLSFDSVQIKINDLQIAGTKVLPFNASWIVMNCKTGANSILVDVYKNGSNFRVSRTFNVLSDVKPELYKYKVVKVYPHDRKAYTQGLFIDKNILYEATGLKGESTLRKTKLETGDIVQSFTIPNDIFGEGITLFNNQIIQLSWQSNVGFVYNKETFELIRKFDYDTEGWGITNDGKKLIMSDGTNNLYFIETQSFTKTGKLEVFDNKGPVNKLNELEYIDGVLFANIYLTDTIVKIDPVTGKVLAYIDMAGILPQSDYQTDTDVLNGIAYNNETKKLYVTGKNWPKLFEIKLEKK